MFNFSPSLLINYDLASHLLFPRLAQTLTLALEQDFAEPFSDTSFVSL